MSLVTSLDTVANLRPITRDRLTLIEPEEEYPVCVELKGIGSVTAAKLSSKSDSNTDAIFLYNDGCVPTESAEHMKSYLERLTILAKLKVN